MQAAIERVQLVFALTNIIDLCVSNNILYIAISGSTVVRIDLDNPTKVQDIQLPKSKHSLLIRRLHVDPTGMHLIVDTTDTHCFYLHSSSSAFRPLKLASAIHHIAWHRESAFYSSESSLYRLDLNSLKIERKKESVQRLWSTKDHNIRGVAVIHDTLYILGNHDLYTSDTHSIQPQVVQHVDNLSQLVSNDTHYVLVSPRGVLNRSKLIETETDRIILSKYHILAFTDESIDIYNQVNNKLVHSVSIPSINGIAADAKIQTYWIYNESTLFEVKIENETQGMWQTYLENGEFDNALDIASASDKQLIYKEYGDHKLKEGENVLAAKYYGLSNHHIEGLALKFIELNDKPSLVQLFKSRLQLTKNTVQQVVLATWVAELLLQENNNDEFKEFVQTHMTNLNSATLLNILKLHGNMTLLLWFANYIHDYQFVVNYYIEQSNWEEALKVLREHEEIDLIYKNSKVLLLNCPQSTVETWMRIPSLDPQKLLPALLSYSSAYKGKYKGHQAIRYLKYLIAQDEGHVPAPLYNAVLMIYSQTDSEDDLLSFLQSKASKFPDYNFGLRVCLENNKTRCAVYLYTLMGLHEEAVTISLKEGLTEQAIKIVEEKVDNEQLRRILWLEIAKKIISTKGTADVLTLTENLSVEDLLKLFPEFETLDQMVPEVVKALEASSNNLIAIHQEMQDSIRISDGMQQKIRSFKKLYAIIEPGEPCHHCGYPLATRKFYVFPCQHGFHSDCIVSTLEKSGKGAEIKDIRALHQDTKELDRALEPIVGADCLICSESRIDSIDAPITASW